MTSANIEFFLKEPIILRWMADSSDSSASVLVRLEVGNHKLCATAQRRDFRKWGADRALSGKLSKAV